VQFHDLLRTAIASSVGDLNGNTDQLRTNLTAIKKFLTAFPEEEPLIALRDVTFSCRTDGPACLEAEASLRRREIQGRFHNGRKDQSGGRVFLFLHTDEF
jgi:hypothetical protein